MADAGARQADSAVERASARPLIAVSGLTKRYGALIAVDNVDMQVSSGEIRAVIGPNGAGKTTLFHLITGVVKPTVGSVRFAGEDITGLPAHAICQRGLSRTFQLTSLFPEMTARENVALAAQARNPRRWLPFGGGSVFARRAECRRCRPRAAGPRRMSRAGLPASSATATSGSWRSPWPWRRSPKVLLLDEPTQGLSVEETAQAVDTLSRFLESSRVTALLVEHDMEVVFRLAHKITVLHRGAVIADGPPEAVKADARRAAGLPRGHRLMLSIQNLNTHYGASHVLQGVDLELARGRIAAVLGRNGVGKTTTVKTIMGLVQATSGTVALEGRPITAWPPHRVARAGVAYVPEGRLIFPDLTVVENIRVAERTPAKAWPLERLLTLFPSLERAPEQPRLAALGRRAADAGDRARPRQRSQGAAPRRAEPGPGAAGGARAGAHHPPAAATPASPSC